MSQTRLEPEGRVPGNPPPRAEYDDRCLIGRVTNGRIYGGRPAILDRFHLTRRNYTGFAVRGPKRN
jgi:hypothetical protein